ncbi:sensor histidine kinase [Streptomyces sp. NBC_01336]|uniref:sensor histidine kinase n=1 Tax=unclassified Streptomyces TaxID=2593676 RepID=UPI002E146AE0|nr:sensor histidine kinase [Streptomyces sp. NBC_01336]
MPHRFRRHLRDNPRTVDLVVIPAVFALALFASLVGTWGTTAEQLDWRPGAALAAIACTALWWHRSHPRAVAAVTAVCASAASGFGYLATPLLLSPAMAGLYWLATETDRRTARLYGLAAIALLVPTALITDRYSNIVLATLNPAVSLLLPVAWGSGVRLRRAYLESLHTRAEHAERTREEEARHRVAEERVRIARELHDVVAHHLALANAQAGTAAHLVRRNPAQAERLIIDLAGTTSSALRELKATVGLLRSPDDPDSPLEPAPGLDRLPDLITAHEAAGLRVTVTTEGDERTLAPGVDLTAYRIIQEALTNVTKHAAAHGAHVTLTYAGHLLTITVSDDGSGAPASDPAGQGGGFGLIGMRERARSAGGRFHAGRRPDGGFTVTAELPLHF